MFYRIDVKVLATNAHVGLALTEQRRMHAPATGRLRAHADFVRERRGWRS